jgi:hypothetical protein
MIIDGSLLFDAGSYSPASGLTGVNQFAGGVSTNVLDMGVGRDVGQVPDPKLRVFVLCTTAYLGGTSLNIQLQGSTDNVTYVTYAESGAIPLASLLINTCLWNWALGPQTPLVLQGGTAKAPPRYYRLNYVVAGSFTAGAVIAGIIDAEDPRYYVPGVVVAN